MTEERTTQLRERMIEDMRSTSVAMPAPSRLTAKASPDGRRCTSRGSLETSLPTDMGPLPAIASAARPCEFGLAARPQRLSGLSDLMANGAPHSEAGSITPALPGLPFAACLAPRGEAGK